MQPNADGSPGQERVRDVAATSNSAAPYNNLKDSAPGGGAEWFTPGRFAFILAACIFAAYPEVVLGMRTFFFRDFGYFGYPLAFQHRESFWRGEVPLWNPLSDCGLPFLAQWNTMVLYPGSLFYLVCPLSWSLAVFCLVHQFLGGLGMYLLAARWTQNRFAASVAGMVFAFNGLTLNCLMWPNNIAAFGWMPWVVLQMERAWNEGGRQTILAAMLGAIQMLAGAPEIILFTWAVAAVMLAAQMLSLRRERRFFIKRFLVVVLLVVGLTAVQLFSFLDLLIHSQRDTSFGRSSWSMPGTGWVNFLVPLFHCFSANQGVFFQYDQWWTSSYYIGVAPLVLALCAALRLRERRVRILTSLAALSLILALGDNGYVYKWLRQAVPQFGFLRYPIKFVVLGVFCLPLLTSYAIRWFHTRAPNHTVSFWRPAILGWVGVSAITGAILWFAHRYPYQWDEWPATWHNGLAREAFFTGIVLLWIATLRVARLRVGVFLQVGLLFLIWMDLMTHAPRQNPTVQRAALEPGLLRLSPSPKHGVSRAMISPIADIKFRLTSVSEGQSHYIGTRLGQFSNCNLLDDMPKVNGFFSLYLRETDQICSVLYAPQQTELPHLLDFLNVSHITAPDKLFDWEVRTNYLPFVTGGQRPIFAEGTNAFQALVAPDFAPQQVVYLPEEARPFITAQACTARIRDEHFSKQRGEFTVEVPNPALVVISQSYYHFWRVFVDGNPTRLWRANHAFQAVEVPPGRHEVKLVYGDSYFVFGVAVSVLTLLGCLYPSTKFGL